MSFLSLSWVACMWLTVGLYWLAPRAWRDLVLIGLSLAFLLAVSPASAGLLVAFCAVTHLAGNRLNPTWRNVAVAGGAMAACLVAFKLRQTIEPVTAITFESVLIPLGLSYYTFRCLHFLIERAKGRIGHVSLRELAAYLFFLPTFVIGPIHRFDAFAIDQRRQRLDPGQLSMGFERIVQGYAKIVILSNFATEQLLGDYIAGLPNPDGAWGVYLGIVRSGLNLYLQFSGHSDVAIGFALMLGFRVMENFDWPYLQPNISAFWQSWHRSLSRWCRDYIYGPVVAGSRSPALGAATTMVVIGLWHEVSLRFLLWGVYHGLGLVAWQAWQDRRAASSWVIPDALRGPFHVLAVLLTVHFVWFGFTILTVPSVPDALMQARRLLGGS